ncbi:hypothetical protein MBOU_02750 [Mycobacterium bourgelatii]|uniref:MFS transporter n=1 Tax=Mycobacterium bourgelatii TaxID=1273442 RepID=A0A7I9YIA4_MYCBU|nr:hypothetical protein MBOU_02750 [Mycobacterium bourgelatii]
MSCNFCKCAIIASVWTLLRNVLANSAALGLAAGFVMVLGVVFLDQLSQPITKEARNTATAATANAARIVFGLFPIALRLDCGA